MTAQLIDLGAPPRLPSDAELKIPHGADPESAIMGPIAGRYDPKDRIARGGMGIVYRAHDRLLNRTVAVKVMRGRYMDRPDLLRRFLAEARINGRLQHPGIVPVYEVGTLADARPFIAMKLIEGQTLHKHLRERSSPTDNQAHYLKVFEALCQTMAYAHQAGVIHRDLKPENVMVGAFGEVQVMDWGLAKFLDPAAAIAATPDGFDAVERSAYLSDDRSTPNSDHLTMATAIVAVGPDEPGASYTTAGEIFGTLAFMPPEQARGEVDRMDRRGDVFALGAILCQILTGQPPYYGASESLKEQAREGRLFGAYVLLDRCGADQALVLLTKHCLSIDPDARPADAGVLAGLVTECLEGLQDRTRQIEVRRITAETRLVEAEAREDLARKARRLARMLAVAGVVVAALLAAGLGWYANDRIARNSQEAHRRTAAIQQVDEALTEAETLEAKARETDSGTLARDAAARQAQAATQRADALLSATMDAPEAFQNRLTEVKGRVSETEREVRVAIALEQWRTELFDSRGEYDAAGAAQRCQKTLAALGFDYLAATKMGGTNELKSHLAHVGLRTVLVDWVFVTPNPEDTNSLVRSLKEGGIDVRSDWLAAIHGGKAEALVALAKSPVDDSVPAVGIAIVAHKLIEAGRIADAEMLLVVGARRRPHDFNLNAQLGLLLRKMPDKQSDAIRHLTAARAARPDIAVINRELGTALVEAKRNEEALEVLHAALKNDPKSADTHVRVADLQFAQGNAEAARGSYTAAIAIDPKLASAHLGIGHIDLAAKQYEAAEASFRAADKLLPSAAAHAGLARVHLKRWEAAKAAAAFRRAVELEPKNVDHRLGLIEALQTANDHPGAIREAREAAKTIGTSAAHRFLAEILKAAGDNASAIVALRDAATAEPKHAATRHALGKLLADAGDELAIVELKLAAELDAASGEIRADLGEALMRFGQFRAAASNLREAAEKLPADHRRREASRDLARKATQWAGLEARLPEVLSGSVTPQSAAAWADLGEMCKRTKRYAAAAQFYKSAAESDSKYAAEAAKCAALAGFGRGVDAKSVSEEVRADLRKKALAAFAKSPEWAAARELSFLNKVDTLATLTSAERAAWTSLLVSR
jgi:serine/threonine protein kinase/Tfp pilus assembly protein PilF